MNPDFAQVEADEQQVNLTQFSQFFPEKREFFLENSGIFYVGDAARNNRVNPAPTPDEDILLFFSRRIGLTAAGEPIPILGGARLTGVAGGFGLGLLSVQTRRTATSPPTSYAVVRLRRNLRADPTWAPCSCTRQRPTRGQTTTASPALTRTSASSGDLDWNSSYV